MRVFVARSDCGPTHAPGLARWARGWWLPLALALALSACAVPISVTRVDPQTVYQELTRNVLSTGERSPFSQYSFVTLTTLGYGDIAPVHTMARSLATAEVLMGQLYPAILIARLVAMELSSKYRESI